MSPGPSLWGWNPSWSAFGMLAVASAAAGVVNAVAGGGSLLSFPAAMAAGLPPLEANATNSAALTPASLASAWAYRRELAEERENVRLLLLPSMLGGLAGSALLLATPQRLFDALVPVLLLLATGLLLMQNLRKASAEAAAPRRAVLVGAQFAVAVYGGYFGAGMGIVMLALFERLGGPNLHRKNALKTVLGVAINGVAALWLLRAGAVRPGAALVMAAAASAGGWAGAAVARRSDPRAVRWVVVALGLVLTLQQAYRAWLALGVAGRRRGRRMLWCASRPGFSALRLARSRRWGCSIAAARTSPSPTRSSTSSWAWGRRAPPR